MLDSQIAERNGVSEGFADVVISCDVGIVEALGQVCAELRGDLHPSRVAAWMRDKRGQDPRSLVRFEVGESQPRHLSEIVEAYSREFDVPVSVICLRAAERLAGDEGGIPAAFGQEIKGAVQAHRRAAGNSAQGKASKGTQGERRRAGRRSRP